jgi:hypothetical protein
MKKLVFVATVSVVLMSCIKGVDLGNIAQDIEQTNTITMPEMPGGVDTLSAEGITLYAPIKTVETNVDEHMKTYNTSTDKVTSVKLTKFSSKAILPEGAKFDFMDTVNVYMSADGLDEKLVAYHYGVPADPSDVQFTCPDLEIKEYFLKPTMNIRFGGHFIKVPANGTQLEMKSNFRLMANPLK